VDDIVDHLEQAADMLGLYAVEATMEQAIALADVLVCAAGEVAGALRKLGAAGDPAAHLAEIRRLENEADRLSRGAVASLFIDRMLSVPARLHSGRGDAPAQLDSLDEVRDVLARVGGVEDVLPADDHHRV
jgi:hypothetical protein